MLVQVIRREDGPIGDADRLDERDDGAGIPRDRFQPVENPVRGTGGVRRLVAHARKGIEQAPVKRLAVGDLLMDEPVAPVEFQSREIELAGGGIDGADRSEQIG